MELAFLSFLSKSSRCLSNGPETSRSDMGCDEEAEPTAHARKVVIRCHCVCWRECLFSRATCSLTNWWLFRKIVTPTFKIHPLKFCKGFDKQNSDLRRNFAELSSSTREGGFVFCDAIDERGTKFQVRARE